MSGIFHQIFFTQVSWRGGCIYMECKWGLSVTAEERVESETWDTFEHSCLLLALPDTVRTLVLPLSVLVRSGPDHWSRTEVGSVLSSGPSESARCERDKGDFFHWPSNFVIRHYWIRNRAWSNLSFCVTNVSIDTRTCSTMLIRFFHRKGGHSYAVL